MANTIRSGSRLNPERGGTSTGLSTSILIEVDGRPVGAIQELRVTTTRNIERVREVGFDGFLEAVPNQPTEVSLDVTRIYFDRMRLPDSFGRIFKNIQHQRVPFNITVYDLSGNGPRDQGTEFNFDADAEVTEFHNCWFRQYSYPYTARDYIISETAAIVCEFVSNTSFGSGGLQGGIVVDDVQGVERASVQNRNRGSLDVAGIVNATRSNAS